MPISPLTVAVVGPAAAVVVAVFVVLWRERASALAASLIRLHLWRLEGIVFLALMVRGQVPALWALPAGIGDILVAATAPWVARNLNSPRGQRRAIIWNVLGTVDLVVAVTLGIMTSPGRLQVFDTVPTSELLTRFPLVLVPTLLVPLAFTLHGVSLWQLLRGPQRSDLALSDGIHRANSTHTGSSIVTGGPGTGDGIPVA